MGHLDLYTALPAGIMLIPLAAFVLILLFGKHLDKLADKIAITAMFCAFMLSIALFNMSSTLGPGMQALPEVRSFTWMNLGGIEIRMGFLIDNLSSFMCMVVTGLATLVLVYSMFYMDGDTMYRRYFGFMCFFCFAMLGIVLSSNLLMTYVFWELVGLGSYFLIGFWFHKPPVSKDHHYQELKASYATGIDERYLSPAHAQKKAFVMNRIGDFGFAIGIGLFFTAMIAASGLPAFKSLELNVSPLDFGKLYEANNKHVFDAVTVWGFSGTELLTIAGIFTFMGAMGKSAQFPLHTWLPDAMQGPTTGSSIIHAATMVAAGVYMTARIHPLLTPGSLFFVSMIGAVTAFLAATMALVQWDIKAVLAYSTISQLGFMMIGLGSGGYNAGVAHLFTHAIFKCMLFLCAGSVIHACHHLQDMNRMGGLRKKMKITWLCMLVGTFAISGVPFFSGFYSKDAILASALAKAMETGSPLLWIPFILGWLTACMTTFYMFRLIFMTFHGEPRDQHIYDHAHESPLIATVPLCILMTLCFGFWWSGSIVSTVGYLPGLSMDTLAGHKGWLDALIVSPVSSLALNIKESGHEFEHREHIHHAAHLYATGASVVALIIGLGIAYVMYIKRSFTPEKLQEFPLVRPLYTLFSQLWFFDRVYQDGIVGLTKLFNWCCWKFDAMFIDRVLVDGWADIFASDFGVGMICRKFDMWIVDSLVDVWGYITLFFSIIGRKFQAGWIQYYVGVTFGLIAFIVLCKMYNFL